MYHIHFSGGVLKFKLSRPELDLLLDSIIYILSAMASLPNSVWWCEKNLDHEFLAETFEIKSNHIWSTMLNLASCFVNVPDYWVNDPGVMMCDWRGWLWMCSVCQVTLIFVLWPWAAKITFFMWIWSIGFSGLGSLKSEMFFTLLK